jgi:hypothetical protein
MKKEDLLERLFLLENGIVKKLYIMANCMSCGGPAKRKMAKGGSTPNKLNNARGFAKAQKGGTNFENGMYGVPNAGPTGDNLSGTYSYKKGGTVKKVLKKAESGASVEPSFGDKINLAAKRVGRNITNRKAVNQLQRSSKVFNSDRSKADALYNKAEATYNKAVDKNKAINKFKKEEGFAPGGDGTYFGQNKYSKPGPIFSKQKKGGSIKNAKLAALAAPKNKITRADIIAGALKNKNKKK